MIRDISGNRYGYLKVVSDSGKRTSSGNVIWLCKCDCGKVKEIASSKLIEGDVKSCGCMHYEACKTHGMSETRLYHIWRTMKARCMNEKSHKYHRYGARGIKICEEWMDFKNFYDWSITNGYSSALSIDRIDNDGNYEPDNCRWATAKEQANNKSTGR